MKAKRTNTKLIKEAIELSGYSAKQRTAIRLKRFLATYKEKPITRAEKKRQAMAAITHQLDSLGYAIIKLYQY